MEVRLDIEAERDEEQLAQIQKYLDGIPELVRKSKEAFKANCENETIQMFIDCQMEGIDEESLLDCFGAEELSEITQERFLDELKLTGISVGFAGECVLDFCLDKELTDELLAVCFGRDMEIKSIDHES